MVRLVSNTKGLWQKRMKYKNKFSILTIFINYTNYKMQPVVEYNRTNSDKQLLVRE